MKLSDIHNPASMIAVMLRRKLMAEPAESDEAPPPSFDREDTPEPDPMVFARERFMDRVAICAAEGDYENVPRNARKLKRKSSLRGPQRV